MADIKEMVFNEETKVDHVKAPWEDEMENGDFVSYAPSYVGGKERLLFDKFEYPSEKTGDFTYYLYNPLTHGAKADGKYPLLIWFHGFNCADGINVVGHSGGEQFASEKYQEELGGGAFILVPMANEKWVDGQMQGSWCEDYFDPLANLIRDIQEKFSANLSKTMISGGSSGGFMSWILAEKYTELFDICVPIASGYIPEKKELDRMADSGLVTLVMHGKHDELCSFDENVLPRIKDLETMKNCTLYFPEWVKNGDGGVASLNFGFEMGQHCLINQAQANLMFTDGTPYDERFPKGLTGWIKEQCEMKNRSSNPIIKSIYTADPAPMVYGDTLYLYTTHDEDELINDFYTMFDWRCYSTKDMVNWTDHGKIFSLDDITWADDRAWAPQCVERNGKFYLYCPVHKIDGGMAIAVGVSDNPAGPFKDLGYPLIDEGDWNDIDPTVFIDDDGQAYLYFGNPELRYVLLNEDMISYNQEVGIGRIPMTVESFAKGGHFTGTTYGEGPWFYKRNDLYYMVYAAFAEGEGNNEHFAYSTSKGPTGPWVYGGVLMDAGPCFTNHPGIADFKGHSYLFYHTDELPGGSLFHRSVCVAEFEYNEDGSINKVEKCDGVDGI